MPYLETQRLSEGMAPAGMPHYDTGEWLRFLDDAAVDAAYGRKGFRNDAERVAFLFDLYQKYTSLLPAAMPSRSNLRRR